MPTGIQMTMQDPQALQQQAEKADSQPTTEVQSPSEVSAPETQTSEIADTALNGAQVTAASMIVEKVANGMLPRESGIAQLVYFFQLDPSQAEEIMGPAGTNAFNPAVPDAQKAPQPEEQA
jgi:hypothetical protein